MRFIFTDQDRYFKDEYQEAWLSEETGWWTPEGEIYVWIPGQEKLKQIGVAIHEAFEWFILCVVMRGLRERHRTLFSFLSDVAHNIANVLEFIISCGRADQYWGRQVWYDGKNQGFSQNFNRPLPIAKVDLKKFRPERIMVNGVLHNVLVTDQAITQEEMNEIRRICQDGD